MPNRLITCLLILALMAFAHRRVHAQATFPFTLYSFVFTDNCWNLDTGKYIHNEIKDTADLFNVYRSYKFSSAQFFNCYNQLTVSSQLTNDLPTIPQNRTLDFSFGSDSTKTHHIFYAGSDTTTAIFIIPGSGINQSTGILNQLWNYHNLNCHVPFFLQNYGDVFLYVKPNEDYRAHWTSQFGPMSKIGELGIIQTLMGMGKSYAANYLIECIATIKYLKAHYQKVIVVGLSQGGSAALYAGMESEPDGVYVASGYSILFDNAYPASNSNQIYFDSILTYYNSTKVKSSIAKQNTDYLFGWNTNEGVYFSDYEVQTNATTTFFNGVPNITCQTSYFAPGNHTFNCTSMANLINSVKAKAKVKVIPIDSVCLADSMNVLLEFTGTPPYSFSLFKDSALLNTYSSPTNSFEINLTQSGRYQIRNLVAGNMVSGFNSSEFVYTKDTAVNFQLSSQIFNCDSNRTEITYSLTGKAPWLVDYIRNNIFQTDSIATNHYSIFLSQDTVNFLQVTDANHCSKITNLIHIASDSNVNAWHSVPAFDCDSSKTRIDFVFSGKSPWKLYLKKDGIPDSVQTSGVNLSLYLTNGLYELQEVRDANNCGKLLNEAYSFNYQPVSASMSAPVYHCDSNQTEIIFNAQGNAPFTLNYSYELAPMQLSFTNPISKAYFTNGNYAFTTLTDATGCVDTLGQNHSFQYDTVDVVLAAPVYDCDSNKTRLHLDLQGNAPWTLFYTFNGLPQQITLSNAASDLYLANGTYQLLHIADSTSCIKSINQVFTFNYQPVSASMSAPVYHCDSNKTEIIFSAQGNAPFTLDYSYELAPMQLSFTNPSSKAYFTNGNYAFTTLTDATGCVDTLAQNHGFLYDTVDIVLAAPIYDCDSNKTHLHLDLQGNAPWTLFYTFNGLPQQITLSNAASDLYLSNGTYQLLHIADSTSCIKPINQVFTFNYQPVSAFMSAPVYHCDSNQTEIIFSAQGNAPFTLDYSYELAPMQLIFTNPSSKAYFANGNYAFNTLTDATGCVDTLGQNHSFLYDTVDVVLAAPVYDCDSNKTRLHLDLQGNAPWTLFYTFNGLPQQVTLSNAASDLYLSNGTYQLLHIADSTACIKPINQVFTFNYQPVSATMSAPVYHCDSNKTEIIFSAQGNASFTLDYTYELAPMQLSFTNSISKAYFTNGNYAFTTLTDATGCVDTLGQNHSFQYDTVDVVLAAPVYDCDSNKTHLHLDLQGNAPWTLFYTFNGLPQQSTLSNAASDLYLSNGTYQLLHIADSTACIKPINQVFTFNYQPVSAFMSAPVYHCDSNKTEIIFSAQGNAPFTLNYTYELAPMQLSFTNSISKAYFANGNYAFNTLTDATGCVDTLGQNHSFQYDTVDVVLAAPVYDCDSNKTHLHLDLQGNAPWTLFYTFNGLPQQVTLSNAASDLYLTNGTYQLLHIADSTSCIKPINQVFTFNYQPVSASMSAPVYHCDSNKTEIIFSAQGNAPFTLDYNYELAPMQLSFTNSISKAYFANGNYAFTTLTDATGCVDSLGQNHSFQYDTVDVVLAAPIYDCDSNKTHLHLDLQGNAPWTLFYTFNGLPQQITLSNAASDLYLTNGTYQLLHIADSTSCIKPINQVFTFNYQAINASITQQVYDCDSNKYRVSFAFSGNAPWTVHYELNGGFQYTKTFVTTTGSIWLPNGNWNIQTVTDQTGCTIAFNLSLPINIASINAAITAQTYDCDSNKLRVEFNLQGNSPWTIHYLNTTTGIPYTLNSISATPSLYLPNGLFQIINVTDLTSCNKTLNQLASNFYTPLSVQKTGTSYRCDSNKVRVDYQFTGDGPWTIQYRNLTTATNMQKVFSVNNGNILHPTGQYAIQTISDSKCTLSINDTIQINFPALSATLSPPLIDCDSQKNNTTLQVNTGLKPFTLSYLYDNFPVNLQTNQMNSKVMLPNGTYYFLKLTDSVGCQLPINFAFNAQYTPLEFDTLTSRYLCASDSTEIKYVFAGQWPVDMLYRKNGGSLETFNLLSGEASSVTNGAYYFSHLRDNAGCVDSVKLNKLIDNQPIQFQIDSITPDCELKLHEITLSTRGTSPWYLFYNYENQTDTLLLSDTLTRWKTSPGDYNFLYVRDADGCDLNIAQRDTLPPFIGFSPHLETDFKAVQVQASDLRHAWYYNELLIDTSSKTSIPVRGDGTYYVVITDSAGCRYTSDSLLFDYPDQISLYPNPAGEQVTVLVQENYGEFWNYQLTDSRGFTVTEGFVETPLKTLDIGHLSTGTYTIRITFSIDGGKNKKILRLLKR